MARYVKFLRGTPTAYANLAQKDSDTLYFIYEEDESKGVLYLGSKLIAGENEISGIDFLSELKDVLITEHMDTNSFLVYDTEAEAWINKSLQDLVFLGATEQSSGVSGFVPAPQKNQLNLFLRSDGTWAKVPGGSEATEEELNRLQQQIDKKVDAVEGSRLMTNEEGEKLASLKNCIVQSINNAEFKIDDKGELNLLDLPISKVVDLTDILNKGQQTSGGYYLVSADEKSKINSIKTDKDGNLELPASHVQNLDLWITEHSSGDKFVVGLSQHSLTNERLEKLESSITDASEEFIIQDNKLSIKEIAISKVTNLDLILNDKVSVAQFNDLAERVNTDKGNIAQLQEILTWGELI